MKCWDLTLGPFKQMSWDVSPGPIFNIAVQSIHSDTINPWQQSMISITSVVMNFIPMYSSNSISRQVNICRIQMWAVISMKYTQISRGKILGKKTCICSVSSWLSYTEKFFLVLNWIHSPLIYLRLSTQTQSRSVLHDTLRKFEVKLWKHLTMNTNASKHTATYSCNK